MGESRRKKERRAPIKSTDKLPPIPTTTDRALSSKQRAYCKAIISKMLDDESSLSFSKPVEELWDPAVLTDYFERIKKPMDLGTVRKRCASAYTQPDSDLFDPNAFRAEARLVFLNALEYNAKGTDLARYATRFIHFVDNELVSLPLPDEPDDTPMTGDGKNDEKSGSKNAASDKSAMGDKSIGGDDDDDEHNNGNVNDDVDDDDDAQRDEHMRDNRAGKGMRDDRGDKETETLGDDTPSGEADDAGEEASRDAADQEERDQLERQIASLNKTRAHANAVLAEIELQQSAPLSYDEMSALRDEVEALPWETSQKVVNVLRKHVNEALEETEETDPEFVTLEFSAVETKLLRQIESFVRPDPRMQEEKEVLHHADRELETVKRKLKRLSEGGSSSKKKRAKKSR